MKMGHRHGEGDRREVYVFFPHKVTTFCCSPVKKIIRMKMKMAWIMQTSRLKKIVLSITIHLKLTKGHIGKMIYW